MWFVTLLLRQPLLLDIDQVSLAHAVDFIPNQPAPRKQATLQAQLSRTIVHNQIYRCNLFAYKSWLIVSFFIGFGLYFALCDL